MSRLLIALAVLLAAVPASAQSLGEAAAREREKRQRRAPREAKVYTDADLKKLGEGKEKGKEGDGDGAPASSAEAGGQSSEEVSGDPGRGSEAAWRDRARGFREAIRNLELSAQETQSRLDALLSDRNPYGLTDPNRLQTLEAEKAQLREALERNSQELVAARQGLDELHDEARRRSVPPGWLRE